MIQDGCSHVMQGLFCEPYCCLPRSSHPLSWAASPETGVMHQPTAGDARKEQIPDERSPFSPPSTHRPAWSSILVNLLPPDCSPPHSQVPNCISSMLSPGTSPKPLGRDCHSQISSFRDKHLFPFFRSVQSASHMYVQVQCKTRPSKRVPFTTSSYRELSSQMIAQESALILQKCQIS